MNFTVLDLSTWPRKEYFQHYFSSVPCTYSMTVKLDITNLKQRQLRLYPAMLYALTTIVNRHEEFRTALNSAGQLGFYQEMSPCYTIFHKDTKTFSLLWTETAPTLSDFSTAYTQDLEDYGDIHTLNAKPNLPENTFSVSMLPWSSFDGFHLNLQKGYQYLLPIFTIGKYIQEAGRYQLPIAIQVHHAVCDGFHVCRFVQELQELLDSLS
ncbi:MAG: type A chloramphenicol O-acetyltransferase [Lawsonibacter sp.]|jgi:chloramphenicol O-acetyltransferase type A